MRGWYLKRFMNFLNNSINKGSFVLTRLFSTASNNIMVDDKHAHQVSFLER